MIFARIRSENGVFGVKLWYGSIRLMLQAFGTTRSVELDCETGLFGVVCPTELVVWGSSAVV